MNSSQSGKQNLLEGRQVPGYWIFRGDTRQFMLDVNCAAIFGIEQINEWISEDVVLEHITMTNMERYFRVTDTRDLGSIIFEDIRITQGPNAGQSYVINGSVLTRFPDGKVRYATGYMVNAQSTFSEFIAREIAGDDFFSWDVESGRLRFSSSYCHLLGYDESEFPQTWDEWVALVHPDDRDMMEIEHHITVTPYYGDSFEFCLRLRHYDGHYIWALGRGIVLGRNENGVATSLIGSFSDINLVQDNFDNIKQLLYTDTLTGLKNRSFFQHNSARWQDERSAPVSVIYADVTGLKITNDVLGHADGDILLLTVTEALTTVVTRPCDIMRLAGDEFLVIMTRCDADECAAIMNDMVAYIDRHNSSPEVMPTFVGFGRATMGEVEHDTLHACIERADVRMQANKDANRKDNYGKLKVYLEKRKGRPVSMRDGRRLEYLSPEQREHMHDGVPDAAIDTAAAAAAAAGAIPNVPGAIAAPAGTPAAAAMAAASCEHDLSVGQVQHCPEDLSDSQSQPVLSAADGGQATLRVASEVITSASDQSCALIPGTALPASAGAGIKPEQIMARPGQEGARLTSVRTAKTPY